MHHARMKQAREEKQNIGLKFNYQKKLLVLGNGKLIGYLVVGDSGSAQTSLSAENTGFKLRREASTGKLVKWWRFFVKSILGALDGLKILSPIKN